MSITGTTPPKEPKTYLTTLIEYDGSNNPIYIGEATAGTTPSAASWSIKKINYDGSNNPTGIQWAGGSSDFDKIWDDRAAYSYS